MRSNLDDSNDLVGKRTFLHPVIAVSANHKSAIHPYSGAPQSIYSDHFLTKDPENDPIGFKLETAPLHPILASSVIQGHGQAPTTDAKTEPFFKYHSPIERWLSRGERRW